MSPAAPPTLIADRSLAVVAAGAVALVVVAGLAVVLLGWAAESGRRAEQGGEIRASARRVRIAIADAESGQRGYIVTQDAAYLLPFQQAVATIDAELAHLSRLIPPTHPDQTLVDSVNSLLQIKLAEMSQTIEDVRRGDHAAAVRLLSTDAGQRAMEGIRAGLGAIIGAQEDAIAVRSRRQAEQFRMGTVVIVGGSTLTFGSLVLGLLAARRHRAARALAFRDLSEHRERLEAQGRALASTIIEGQRANTALARSNRDLDQFAYVASHDLKAPLRGIASLATWIDEDLGDAASPEVKEHLRLMSNRVRRLEGLIDGILAYARTDKLGGTIASVDIRALVDDVVDLCPPPSGVEVTVRGDWPTLRTDPVPLQQVLTNLLGNAYLHGRTPDRAAHVEVGAAPSDEGTWQFWVQDDGPGVDPAFHDKIFQIFQTLAPRDQVETTGIGLAVVRKLVDAHGGRVWIDSTPGHGARLSFTWSPA